MSATKRPPFETWSTWRDEARGPKPPPPAHGIKIKNAGTTWWGRRWIDALEKLSPDYASRLARGKTYARAGRTHDLVVRAGEVTAKVTGSRPEPYAITITLATLGDEAWSKGLGELASKARYSAQLLAGEMPEDVDEVLRGAGVSLFPVKAGDLTTSCSCPDWANPCKHVAATHYVLAEAFDRDPFLLFELRGRTREGVLAVVTNAKANADANANANANADENANANANAQDADAGEVGVGVGRMSEEGYDAWRGGMPALRLSFARVGAEGALIASLGRPASWREVSAPVELLGPAVRAASSLARELALGAGEATVDPERD